jgi:Flp pilus assembly pilin Flp
MKQGGTPMRTTLLRLRRNDDGLSTAEYAVGTVAVAGLGGLLVKLLTSEWLFAILQRIIERAFSVIFG